MSDFEDKTKEDTELFLRETPELKVRNQLSRMKEPLPPSFGGLQQVTPPSRDGKIRKRETAEDKKKRFRIFLLIVMATLGAIALMNYRRVADFTYTGMATVEMMKGDMVSAAKHYKDAYFINPDDVNPLLFAASIHLGQKQDQLAKEEFDIIFKTAKDPAFVHNQRAKILSGMGRTDDALADWTEAIRINPNYYAAHGQRALIYMKRKQYKEALVEWDAAIKNELSHKDVFCLSNKASVLSDMRRYSDALDTINLALERDPDNAGLIRQRDYFRRHVE
ncbi:MAG: tetratricopeptide repeat protein [Cyanobacteria bacterium SZAS-4]|nr:tetratricopeptide repeat protein [Cyanobacteria bacterium SZAS-4]